jgi:hypothetical protein
MNALETNVNNKEASATSSALVCTSAANFQGTWTNQTTVVGQSWAYNGLVYIVLVAGNTSPTTSPSNWMILGIDAQTHSAASKTTPVDADEVPIVDSASSFSLKKLTWGNLKATLKAYFDSIYANLSSPALTGTPTAPTATAGTNTTQIATTAFVLANGGIPKNSQTFTSSGTFTVPASVTQIMVVGSHAGNGGGGGGGGSTGGDGGGGGASVFSSPMIMSVSPSQQFTVTIGAGGAGGSGGSGANGGTGSAGGTTQFGSFNFYNNLGGSGGGGGGATYIGGSGGGSSGGSSGATGSGAPTAGGGAGIGYAGPIYSLAGGAAANSGGAGIGGTSSCNNGSAGSVHSGGTGGAGGAGGAGKIIVYW